MAFNFDRDKLQAFMSMLGGDSKSGTGGDRKPAPGIATALTADTATAPSGGSIFEGGTPSMFDPFTPESREQWKDIFGSDKGFNDFFGGFKQRLSTLPLWGEKQMFDLSNLLGGMIGNTGLSGMENEAVGGIRNLLEPQAPGGNAFAQMVEALTPARERQEDRQRKTQEESLARAGMFRSGAGQQLLSNQATQNAEQWAATLAPMAMGGEQLAQQAKMFGLPMLAGLGATEYGRQYDPMNQLLSVMGALSGNVRPAERQGTGFWDVFTALGAGALSGDAIEF